ncbi:hypothetical protein G3495_18405 [Shewanella baltica]|uniref:hypothetical protein n=1 Tax=Shewanella baltica TaxID=62322 RepID=UPI00217EFB95|nr:hypothetical protein [Shewanella baltica]MCS6125127.1 hypothetical protein [Shewanella baltica]MCS6237063.1 hypothetical protein [Shewanella baltica]MCS6259979.1 hypothetical protein [Shewanella baltica]MCS6271643.1 hypothetical protein [Shewanella baltica]
MHFKQLSPTIAIMAKTRTQTVGRWIFASLVASITLFNALGFEHWSYGEVIIWSFIALLSWHLLFARRRIQIDLERQLITTKVSSLYPLTQQVIPINYISAFQIQQRLGQLHGYDLLIVMDTQIEPLKFQYGNLPQMQAIGKQLSTFCNVTLLS